MLKDKITCLIFSCDKFSDLWEGNLKLLRQNWGDRDFDTYIVSDKESNCTFPDVKIIAPKKEVEWSDRLKFALQYVKTEYVFVTLDDYFLIEPVNTKRMESLVNLMISDKYDYIRLFKNPTNATGEPVLGYDKLYHIRNQANYSVNLYSGFWTKEFLSYCVREPRSAWMFEVTLHKQAVLYNAKCLVSCNKDYVILDVVRKGKLLHNAARYFKKHPGIYEGNRELQSTKYEFKLWWKTFVQEHVPSWLFKPVRAIYVKFGGQSFTYQKDREYK
ncbi:hypothetical protein [uncultured Bacteroides sp.]|uniref:hypothetical protein n=1 Tax=uncultured Bacteroides sp. TaxID=162156 RepID=UPI002AAAFFBB|nr:hypothetical protein [uncultured Bacteroides sp.]